MLHTEPATRLRTDYNRIAYLAWRSGNPVYITKNGKLDLIAMNANAFENRHLVIKLSSIVLESEIERLKGTGAYGPEEVENMLKANARS